ncbi:hypothetical protein AB0M43_14415 [Longispora sp. NPDC051575]|uniref:hypothetical protein n=1 Tax=Longispora sp. NPDC051575 TaxID=3154943 RepID=UPI00342B1ACA
MTSTAQSQSSVAPSWRRISESHLRIAERVFGHLTIAPRPVLTLDCDTLTTRRRLDLGVLPRGTRSLAELRDWLLEHPKAYLARDIVWREVTVRARAGEQGWTTGAVGLAMPALVRSARYYADGYRGEPADIANEILVGFLSALTSRDLEVERPALFVKLCWAAWRAGRAFRLGEDVEIPVPEITQTSDGSKPASCAPREPFGHTDLLVHRAAALGIVDHDDVDVWIDSRLAGKTLALLAAERAENFDALRMRLARADTRIAAAIEDGLLTSELAVSVAARAQGQAPKRRAGRAAAGTAPARRRRVAAPGPMWALAA